MHCEKHVHQLRLYYYTLWEHARSALVNHNNLLHILCGRAFFATIERHRGRLRKLLIAADGVKKTTINSLCIPSAWRATSQRRAIAKFVAIFLKLIMHVCYSTMLYLFAQLVGSVATLFFLRLYDVSEWKLVLYYYILYDRRSVRSRFC